MDNRSGENPNIAASWPIIVNEQALSEASILPHLLHEASEEALHQQQQQRQQISMERNGLANDGSFGRTDNNSNEISTDLAGSKEEQQLQSMIENYSKHVILQKQQQQHIQQQQSRKSSTSDTGRSASHLQRKMNPPPTPMSHSHPCLFSDGGNSSAKISDEQAKRVNTIIASGANVNHNQLPQQHKQKQQSQPMIANLHMQKSSDSRDEHADYGKYAHLNGQQQSNEDQQTNNENAPLRQKIDKLQRKCDRLEQLEYAYRRIERDYEQMLGQQEHRDELSRIAMQKLEQQLRGVTAENEQLRAQCTKFSGIFGGGNQGDQQIHFLLNELIPKNNELLMVQERQRLELEAQSATLEEQRTHIEVMEKALANAQERLAAKDRTAIDAVAVVDKCTHLQRMLQDALEDKQRQKEQHGRRVAQLEMELTQLRLQLAKENHNTTTGALGSLGRKAGTITAAGGGGGAGIQEGSAAAADEVLKLRKILAQREARINQLEQSLMQIQGLRQGGGNNGNGMEMTGGGGETQQQRHNGRMVAELETRAIRLELEKAEKERRIQELLDEKMRIQMQWAEERRTLDVRVRMLEKDLRHFMGSQSSLASSAAGWAGFGGGGSGIYPPDLDNPSSPYASIRGQRSSYLRHRSTAELPTSARGAALYDERAAMGVDVITRMEEMGRKLAERRAKNGGTEKTTTVQRPSELGLVQVNLDENVIGSSFGGIQSRSSSGDKPLADMSPCSEEHIEMGGARAPMFHRQSAPSSTGSSSKRRHYLVNAPSTSNQLTAYLEQLPEATRRRLTGEKIGTAISGHHLIAAGIEKNGPTATGGVGSRQGGGGCRRLIRDHSVDVGRKGPAAQQQIEGPFPPQLAPPPNYQEAAAAQQQQRREAPAPPPPYQTPQAHQQSPQLRQMNQMSSIEEPMQEPPLPPLPPPAYAPPAPASAIVNIIEVKGAAADIDDVEGEHHHHQQQQQQNEQGDSDTLTGHKQLVFRRSSLGNANLITK